ncbi:MAG: pyridoxamine 5'-phosphate oxidase family protein [Planctomycetaceae bacterium]|nr:pyridoxamine 5'-phosphate oxidase family protein [Planctomycetaceae bacterium]
MSVETQPFRMVNDLHIIEQDCWRHLSAAVDDRDHPWRLPVMATTSPIGAKQRTLVLRKVDVFEKTLWFHTDIRSAKVAQIQADPRASLLFYDQALGVQLQLCGVCTIHTTDSVADTVWSTAAPETLRAYLGLLAPGTETAASNVNLPENVRGRIPTRDEVQGGRRNFAVIIFEVQNADWLHLSRNGNIRAYFDIISKTRRWITP